MNVKYVNLAEDNNAIKDELLKAFETVLNSGLFILGDETKKFEENFAKLIGTKHAIGVNSCTDALHLTLKALGIKKGDEVIVPANSFIASATAIALTGATPVFIDVKENYLIDENKIKKLITRKTKGVMPVHLTGKPCDMTKIMEIAIKYNLNIIEDCAQAILAKWGKKNVGTLGIGCFSFHPLKNLAACGDAGMIVTNDDKIYNKLLQLRNIGLKNRDEADILGYNSRLDSVQATILNVKLKYLKKITEKHRAIAHLYYRILKEKNISGIKYVPYDEKNEYSVYHTFVLQVENRDKLMKFLEEKGIETKIHYPIPIHKQKCFSYLKVSSLEKVETQSKSILSLPIHQNLREEEINFICNNIENFYKK